MEIKNKKILVAQTAYFGDVVLTWHLVWRAHIASGQRVGFLLRPQCASLFEAASDVVEILSFDKRGADKGLSGLLRVAKSLEGKFDVVLSPHPSFRTALLLRLSKIPTRVGFTNSQGSFFYNVKAVWDKKKHETERQKSLIEVLGVVAKETDVPPIPFSSAQKSRADELLKKAGIQDDEKIVGINPFSVWHTKRWLLEYWAKLAELVEEKFKARIVVIGGTSDIGEAEKLLKLSGAKLVSLAGKSDFGVLNALMERVSIFISNDSGPAHVAAMRKVPTVVIFGSTTPELGYVPHGSDVGIVQISLDCRPCGRHGYKKCPKEHFRCMKDITPDMVFEAVSKLLSRSR